MDQEKSPTNDSRKNLIGTILIVVVAFLFLKREAVQELYHKAIGYKFPESKIAWRTDFENALSESQEKGKPVLLVFGATWCPPCKTMKRQVWPDEEITKIADEGFIPMYVDVDDEKLAPLSSRYKILGIPAVLILNSTGEAVQRRNTMSRSETLSFLTSNR